MLCFPKGRSIMPDKSAKLEPDINTRAVNDESQEPEYGTWHEYDAATVLAEEKARLPKREPSEIWPDWTQGRPALFRVEVYNPSFFLGKVRHHSTTSLESLKLRWRSPHQLSSLTTRSRRLPGNHIEEWSGVYRIFATELAITRCCGDDPTGTLYLGRAGSRGQNWSILRTRIQSILTQRHHAIENWSFSKTMRQQFPWESLAIEWAYTGKRLNYKGEPVPEAIMAEGWLLHSYRDSFGEFPPLNEKG